MADNLCTIRYFKYYNIVCVTQMIYERIKNINYKYTSQIIIIERRWNLPESIYIYILEEKYFEIK